MKAAYYEEGARYGRRLAREMDQDEDEVLVGDCSLAGLRVLKESGRRVRHPIEALAEAYGLNVD
jgi:glycerol-3-phosphate dehydrogenase subunit C